VLQILNVCVSEPAKILTQSYLPSYVSICKLYKWHEAVDAVSFLYLIIPCIDHWSLTGRSPKLIIYKPNVFSATTPSAAITQFEQAEVQVSLPTKRLVSWVMCFLKIKLLLFQQKRWDSDLLTIWRDILLSDAKLPPCFATNYELRWTSKGRMSEKSIFTFFRLSCQCQEHKTVVFLRHFHLLYPNLRVSWYNESDEVVAYSFLEAFRSDRYAPWGTENNVPGNPRFKA